MFPWSSIPRGGPKLQQAWTLDRSHDGVWGGRGDSKGSLAAQVQDPKAGRWETQVPGPVTPVTLLLLQMPTHLSFRSTSSRKTLWTPPSARLGPLYLSSQTPLHVSHHLVTCLFPMLTWDPHGIGTWVSLLPLVGPEPCTVLGTE